MLIKSGSYIVKSNGKKTTKSTKIRQETLNRSGIIQSKSKYKSKIGKIKAKTTHIIYPSSQSIVNKKSQKKCLSLARTTTKIKHKFCERKGPLANENEEENFKKEKR
jgi:hypothetical protein